MSHGLQVTRVGDLRPLRQWITQLSVEFGYELVSTVMQPGQLIVSGGNLQLWPVEAEEPYRLEFFGHTLEHIVGVQTKRPMKKLSIPSAVLELDGQKLRPGDLIVHWAHGIGRYETRVQRRTTTEQTSLSNQSKSMKRSYIQIGYADDGKLFVPAERTDLLSAYVGVGRTPRLSKLGSSVWQKTKKRITESIFQLARELLVLYAKRELHAGRRLSWLTEWEEQLETSFPYDLTTDQQKVLAETLADLQRARPMDRLLAGDVGFGKTEVAIRVAAAVVGAGHQVAVLAPTTILVEQHFATFEQRLKPLPIRIHRLSRFASNTEIAETKAKLAEGSVDIVIGTHQLLANDMQFRNLGLVIIDEEQKFGVKQKERLKQLRLDVHVLSLSATPIPRTLFMALSGIRDLSLIQTPPLNRQPIETTILPMANKPIVKFSRRELKRHGQIYLVHNDVQSMAARLKELQALLPQARIAIAHGQMAEERLAQVMHDFAAGQIDILLCSTIIEAGLDLPNVNTLIVERAERFGLADLYQLRGRVGRSDRQGYALFLFTPIALHGPAKARLEALAEMTELGKGYEVALRDLDIRGGGNVLGREQHGNMEALGLMLYTKLLKQAVEQLKQTETPPA